jgi:arabinose-5-phosphate isomerase
MAIVLQKIKGFKEKDFAFFHPRGSLGRKLLLKVKDIMRRRKFNPVVSQDMLIKDVLIKITTAHAGAASVVDREGKLCGIFTDGDLRRNLELHRNLLRKKVKEVMTKNPVVVKDDDLASEALKVLETKRIDEVPVVDGDYQPVGMLDVQDLIAAGIL